MHKFVSKFEIPDVKISILQKLDTFLIIIKNISIERALQFDLLLLNPIFNVC